MKYFKYNLLPVILFLMLFSCGKTFLDVKPSVRTRVPQYKDFQLMLNGPVHYETTPLSLNFIGSDELYIPTGLFNSIPDMVTFNFQRNAYTWQKEIYQGGEPYDDWLAGYLRILNSNIIIDGIKEISSQEQGWNLTYGSALFSRALTYYNLAQSFCSPYDVMDINANLGLALRVEADLTMKVPRSTLADTYSLILKDITKAIELLPYKAESIFKPSQLSCYALLARIHLNMGNYAEAERYASRVILEQNSLMDYNELIKSSAYSFPSYGEGNSEIILYQSLAIDTYMLLNSNFSKIDTNLLGSYADGDLRKELYFDYMDPLNSVFIGSYTGSEKYFTGFTTGEMYLIRAESNSRLGLMDKALTDLNFLRKHRFKRENFTPFNSLDNQEVLEWVIKERRLELVLRGTRWEDLRRLNKETKFAKTLIREVNGQKFELPPNDKRFVWPLPLEAIQIGGYIQNSR